MRRDPVEPRDEFEEGLALRCRRPVRMSGATEYRPRPPMPAYDPAADTRPAEPARRFDDDGPSLGERMYEQWIGGM